MQIQVVISTVGDEPAVLGKFIGYVRDGEYVRYEHDDRRYWVAPETVAIVTVDTDNHSKHAATTERS